MSAYRRFRLTGAGLAFSAVLALPLLLQYIWFDFAAEVLGYVTSGILLGLALRETIALVFPFHAWLPFDALKIHTSEVV